MPSALEALMDIASMRPDLLITDLSMPGVDGIEMLKALKRNTQLTDMLIVVISGLSASVIESRGGLPPQALMLQKPINFDWLHGYVTALVNANAKWRIALPRIGRRSSMTENLRKAAVRDDSDILKISLN
jgi:CheY-like chemotaxis protein